MKDQNLRNQLFGKHAPFGNPLKHRFYSWVFPNIEKFDVKVILKSDDGLIKYLVERIENVENRCKVLEERTKKFGIFPFV